MFGERVPEQVLWMGVTEPVPERLSALQPEYWTGYGMVTVGPDASIPAAGP